ncbi:MAG: hypothetical protein M3P96_11020 [Actinomycetota bacterium]|nr:hypothetical protein [Actinomycetota bacterium]
MSSASKAIAQLRRRREAALRLPPHNKCRHSDPLDCLHAEVRPSSYGLSPADLLAEGRRLRAQGWASWEISARLARPELVGAAS